MTVSAAKMTVHLVVSVGEAGPITRALQQLMIAARTSPGCLGCSISINMNAQVGVCYIERWESEDVLRRELCSERFTTLASLMEHCTAAPQVKFQLPTGTRGLDYVVEVRSSKPG
jgi:quinol monooxygenase YgiN